MAHFVRVLESRNSVQDISKLGICPPGAGEQQQPGGGGEREIVSRLQGKQWLEKCLFIASSPHSHLHKSSRWDRLSCPSSASRVILLGMMTETMWEPQGYSPWRSPGRKSEWYGAISPLTIPGWFPAVFSSSRVVAPSAGGEKPWEQDRAKEWFLVFPFWR